MSDQLSKPATDVRFVLCEACGSEGRDIRCGIVYEAGCAFGHQGDVDHGECRVCEGTGMMEIEVEPIEMEDLP